MLVSRPPNNNCCQHNEPPTWHCRRSHIGVDDSPKVLVRVPQRTSVSEPRSSSLTPSINSKKLTKNVVIANARSQTLTGANQWKEDFTLFSLREQKRNSCANFQPSLVMTKSFGFQKLVKSDNFHIYKKIYIVYEKM